MSDEVKTAATVRAIRAQENYEALKDTPVIKHWVTMGGVPDQRDTGLDDASYNKLLDAIRYGQSIQPNMNQDLSSGIDDIEGLKTRTEKMDDGATKIIIEEDESRFPPDSQLP